VKLISCVDPEPSAIDMEGGRGQAAEVTEEGTLEEGNSRTAEWEEHHVRPRNIMTSASDALMQPSASSLPRRPHALSSDLQLGRATDVWGQTPEFVTTFLSSCDGRRGCLQSLVIMS
jgi:hypothetical protein